MPKTPNRPVVSFTDDVLFECFFWAPVAPGSAARVDRRLLEKELAAKRIVSIDGFVPAMIAGLRLLVDPTPIVFPEHSPRDWPPPEVRAIVARAHAACLAGAPDPFAELIQAVEREPEVADELANTLMEVEDLSEDWWFWALSSELVAAAVAAPREELVARWRTFPAAVLLRGSADLSANPPPLDTVLAALERLPSRRILMGWALEC